MNIDRQKNEKPKILTAVIWVNTLIGAIQLLVFIVYLFPIKPSGIPIGYNLTSTFGSNIAAFFLAGSGIHFLTSYGLSKGRKWARIVLGILVFPFLLAFPIGTIYALTVYFGLSRKDVASFFQR